MTAPPEVIPCPPLPSAVVRGSLEDGLLVCLGLLQRDPERFEAAAVAWHARWCSSLPGAPFADSAAVLSALEAMAGPNPCAGAEALSGICRRYALEKVKAVLDGWLVANSPNAT